MRCNTPNKRSVSKGLATIFPSRSYLIKGNQFKKRPIKNISTLRFITFRQKVLLASSRGITKAIALPTANKKKGKTKSVGVTPCQPACSNGGNICAQLPGLFTKIIRATVAPLNISSE